MRIDSNQPISNQVVTETTARNSGKAGDAANAAANAAANEGATFSAGKVGVNTLEAQVLATPEIRQDRVEALRQAISSGNYQLDPAKMADAMLSEAAR